MGFGLAGKLWIAVWIVRRRGEAQTRSIGKRSKGKVSAKDLHCEIPRGVRLGSGSSAFLVVGSSWWWPWACRIRWILGGMVENCLRVLGYTVSRWRVVL